MTTGRPVAGAYRTCANLRRETPCSKVRPRPFAAVFGIALGSLYLFLSVNGAAARQAPEDPVKYWVFFSGKPGAESSVSADALAPVSDRARMRRKSRGGHTGGLVDIPIDPSYVEAVRSAGAQPVHESRWLNAISAWIPDSLVPEIASLPFVRGIRPVGRTTPARDDDDLQKAPARPLAFAAFPGASVSRAANARLDYGASFQQLNQANAIPNLEQGIDGTGVVLGIIDTGLGVLDHRAFTEMLSEGRFLESLDFTGFPDDGSRHARNVLSIAAGFFEGYLIGPAHGASILHARTEYVPTETPQEEDNFVAGLEWMEAAGVDVVNVSLSYTTFNEGIGDYTYEQMDGETAITTIAADLAAALGVVVVSSAGNDGSCSPETCWYYIGSPADGNDVITVGATTDTLDVKAAFSSFGPTADGRFKPDISAMGVNMTYACGNPPPMDFCGGGNGTSYAAPIVSGIVAQMLQVNPDLTPAEIRDIIRSTARIPEVATSKKLDFPNNSLGWGIVDAAAAVAQAIALDVDIPGPDALTVSPPYPNPTRGSLHFTLEGSHMPLDVRLSVFDLTGRRVLETAPIEVASHRVSFGVDLPAAGIYLYRLLVDGHTATGKLVSMR